MKINVSITKEALGRAAARHGAEEIRRALELNGKASIIVATGASQFEMLDHLVGEKEIDWSRVTGFHLDEYIGMAESHPASFRGYLKKRFVGRLPVPIGAFHYINAEQNPEQECDRLSRLISDVNIDVAFVGIGENAHLAFNDPPADFKTEQPYIVVDLDEACRGQQLGEGWFSGLDEVPKQAISMSVRQILRSSAIICSVPDERKAKAVQASIEGEITPEVPASILQRHPNCTLYLDADSASLLKIVQQQPSSTE